MNSKNDDRVTYFGETDARNKQLRFGIKMEDRLRHMYAIGKTGMGKSTLLENMAVQDIQNGEGMAFIDPHGKSAELLLDYIPEHRIKDVVYFAPFDMEHPISFNVLEDIGPDKRHLVANGLMSAFKKIWVDAWSARMEYILNNIMLALLEFPGSTLLGVNRMLADKEFRNKVVSNITDPSVKSFWLDEYAKYTEKFAAEAAPAIQNKVGQFVSNPLVRNIIGQSKSSFDIRKMMDEKKILIINLSKGRVGEANANLIGSMLVTKIYLAAMSRADLPQTEMDKVPPFYLYVDEFQSFANESFADILSEARKYKLSLTIAHQYIEQMPEEVRAAVFGNVGTMVTFRVGATDAEVLEKEFAPTFTQEDLVNLGRFQMYLKLMIDTVSSRPFSARSMMPIPRPETSFKTQIIEMSRAQFAHPRTEVEEEIKNWHLQRFNDGPALVGGRDSQRDMKRDGGRDAGRGGKGGQGFGEGSGDFAGGNGGAPRGGRGDGGGGYGSSARGAERGGEHSRDRRPDARSETRNGVSHRVSHHETRHEEYRGEHHGGIRVESRGGNKPGDRLENKPENRGDNRGEHKNVLAEAIKKAALERDLEREAEIKNKIESDRVQNEKKALDQNKRVESENDLRKAVSLSYLANDTLKPEKNDKSAKPEQLNALRDLLAGSKKKVPEESHSGGSSVGMGGDNKNFPNPPRSPVVDAKVDSKPSPAPRMGAGVETNSSENSSEKKSNVIKKIREVPEDVLKSILNS